MPKRNRLYYFLFVILTIGLGLFSRTNYIPDTIYPYLGDALYAMLMYFIVGFLFPSMSATTTFLISLGICYGIETSQLCNAEWLLRLRQTRIGALVLGHGFLWSDLLAYFLGSLSAFIVEKKLLASLAKA